MKKILCVLVTPLLMNYSVLLAKEKETIDKTTPTQESTQAADKLIDRKIDELKEALAGLRAARDKGDEASLKLYRTQARSALMELQKVSNAQISSEVMATEKKIANESGKDREGKENRNSSAAEPSPTTMSTPQTAATPEASATPAVKEEGTAPSPSPMASPSPSPTPSK
jgi:hypothetical protein